MTGATEAVTPEQLMTPREHHYERAFYGHGRGLEITQPESGKFVERPMTPGELAAREPSMKIAEQIHKLACYAAFAYVNSWEIIAPVVDAAIREAEANALQRCLDAQPPTAENPKESSYQNGYFDGVMAYANAIRSLLPKEEGK